MDKSASFLQSTAWAEVQQAYGRTVQWLGSNQSTLAIRYPLPFKQWYWFIPQGNHGATGLNDGAMFVRYEPIVKPTHDRHVADVHPSHTLVTPLLAPDQMLERMKQKCRYNIHLAERKDIQIISTTPVETFFSILKKTSERQQIRLHPQRYYETIVNVLQTYDMVQLYSAVHQGATIAVAMAVYHQGTMTYLHGGSDYQYRALMAPYLMHWQMMQDAYAAKFQRYDWFGIAPEGQPQHPFAGITRFKQGFGGEVVERPGTFEQVLRPLWYTSYRMVKKIWTLS